MSNGKNMQKKIPTYSSFPSDVFCALSFWKASTSSEISNNGVTWWQTVIKK